MAKFFVAGLMLLLAGFVGFVIQHENGRAQVAADERDAPAEVATISTGERVDVSAHIVAKDLTLVEFTAAF